MAANVRLLLRLPPCLRLQALTPAYATHNAIHLAKPPFRTTQSSAKILQQARSAVPKHSRTISPAKPTRATASQVSPRSPPVLVYGGGPKTPINIIEPQLDRVLLYKSTDHGAFFVASYILGGFLLLGGFSYAQIFLKDAPDRPIPWIFKSLGALSVVAVVSFGTAFLMAPRNLIKSVAIITIAVGDTLPATSRVLRVEVKRNLPFLKPDILETTPSKMFLDRNVPGALEDINFQNVPLSQARAFTEGYFSKNPEPRQGGVLASLSAANRSLLNLWPAMTRETRRMFLRDQMAYVRIEGNGYFKLDLQNCQLLDGGRPLHRVTTASDEAQPSLLPTLSRIFRR